MDFLAWAIIAFVVSLLAGGLGFSGVARGAEKVARVLFVIFLLIAVILMALFIFGLKAIF